MPIKFMSQKWTNGMDLILIENYPHLVSNITILYSDLHNPCNPQAKLAGTFFRKLICQAHFQQLRGNMPQMRLYFGYLALNMPDNNF